MIPSRKRVNSLIRTLANIAKTASGDDYQIVIRFDDDDVESVSIVQRIELLFPTSKCFIGPRLDGYASLDKDFFRELEEKSDATWVWIGGDDMVVEGDWMSELRKVPTTGYIVQPAISKLGHSTYPRAEAQAYPIFPRFCWKQYAKNFPVPFDVNGHILLKANGWKTWFLEDCTFWHQRPTEKEIEEHRKL
jgi:hypothetical protein